MNKNDSRTKSTSNLIESQRYFDSAFNWYFERHLESFRQGRLFLCCLTALIISAFVLYDAIDTLRKQERYAVPVIQFIDTLDDVSSIKNLVSKDSNEDPNLAVSRYVSRRYVEIRESYEFDNLAEQEKFIFRNSSNLVFLDFKKSIGKYSFDGPILMYGSKAKLEVKVLEINVRLNESGSPVGARVVYKLIEKTESSSKNIGTFEANLSFFMSNVFAERKGFIKFNFTVLNYKTNKTKMQ